MVHINWVRGGLVVLVGMLSVSPVTPQTKDFDARWKDGTQNVASGAGQKYFNEVFFKEFYSVYAAHMTACAQRTGEKPMTDLKAALELGADGRVLTVLLQSESKAFKCFADLAKNDRFSKPPSGHFWLPVTVTFSGS
jgi:hypothetical protein